MPVAPEAEATSTAPATVTAPAASPKVGSPPPPAPVTRASAPAPPAAAAPRKTPYHPDPGRLNAGLEWAYCGPPPPGTVLPLVNPPDDSAPIVFSADSAELFQNQNRALLTGAVVVDRGDQHLEAERLDYHRANGRIDASGGALLQQPGLRVLSRAMQANLNTRQAWAQQSDYRLTGTNARGTAGATHIESETLSHFKDVTYTACPPGNNAWVLQARTLDVDRKEGRGVAHGAKLRVGGVPVLYSPYFSFPLDDRRKSGFLAPSIGSSGLLGLDISTPYYLNLAPNLDATLTPRYMSKRGAMLAGEFRFLTAQQHGQFNGELIPNDAGYPGGGLRGGLSFKQNGLFAGRWATDVSVDLVSDDTYLNDFGRDLRVTSSRNLERRADLWYYGNGWSALGRVQGYQTVDPGVAPRDRPYRRLPELLFQGGLPLWRGLQLGLLADNTYFDHDYRVHGDRVALRPSLELPIRRPYGYLEPRLTLNHASYWLTQQAPGLDTQPSVTVPSFSLDGQLVFERRISWLQQAAVQTLEPRLFYLYTPYRDQSGLPLFDTSELDFSFASLFRDNRFAGADRVGDANQLTLALTTRTLSDRDGSELFRASIGQILYFADRRVQIQGAAVDTGTSAVAAELAARLARGWSGRASVLWDPNRGSTQVRKSSLGIHYRNPEQQVVNLTYRLNEADPGAAVNTAFEDTDLSFRWPVSPRLELVGRWLYSLHYGQTMDAFGGVEYGQCCWRVRALVRQFVSSPDRPSGTLSVMLQVELAGLGAFGNRVSDFLDRNIYDYPVE